MNNTKIHQQSEVQIPAPKKIELEMARKNGKLVFKFNIPPEIENKYKEMQEEVRDSASWDGLKFYFMPELTTSNEYKDTLRGFGLFDDYGKPLFNEDTLNVAWLRTVGGKGEVVIRHQIGFSDMSIKLRHVVEFLKTYFADYYRDYVLRATISADI